LMLGSIELRNANAYVVDFLPNYEFALEVSVSTPQQRHYFLCADSRDSLFGWIQALSNCGMTFACSDPLADWIPLIDSSPFSGSVITYGKQGWLEKRGVFSKAFRRRFCRIGIDPVTGRQSLTYHTEFDAVKFRGVVALQNAKIFEYAGGNRGDNDDAESADRQFRIVTVDRTFFFRADSAALRKEWVTILQLIASLKDSEPVPLIELPDQKAATDEESRMLAKTRSHDFLEQVESPPSSLRYDTVIHDDVVDVRQVIKQRVDAKEEAEIDFKLSEAKRNANLLVNGAEFMKACKNAKPHAKFVFATLVPGTLPHDIDELTDVASVADAIRAIRWVDPSREDDLSDFEDDNKDSRQHQTNKKKKKKKKNPRTKRTKREILRSQLQDIAHGKTTDVFKRKATDDIDERLCFSIISRKRTLDLTASTLTQCNEWVEALSWWHNCRR
jgi:PH domain